MKPTIIFDFDGTIADSFVVIKNILMTLSDDFGYRKPTDDEIISLRTKHPKETIKTLGLAYYKLPFLAHRLNKELKAHVADIKLINGIKSVLLELKLQKYSLGIITSANENNVTTFLKNNELEIFDFIQSGSSIFGKARLFNKIIKKQKIERNNVIYVGDEIRDIEAAKKAGIKIIAVAWGFNDKEGLKQFQPDILIDKPNQLIASLKAVNEAKNYSL